MRCSINRQLTVSNQRPRAIFYFERCSDPMIDASVKQDLREIGKKLTNLRGSL